MNVKTWRLCCFLQVIPPEASLASAESSVGGAGESSASPEREFAAASDGRGGGAGGAPGGAGRASSPSRLPKDSGLSPLVPPTESAHEMSTEL